jgi:hypothetical protein
MKFKERVLIFSSLHEIFIAALPVIALFFKLSEDKKSRIEEIALFSIAVIIALLTFIFVKWFSSNVARPEGYAWGYFYHFLYDQQSRHRRGSGY